MELIKRDPHLRKEKMKKKENEKERNLALQMIRLFPKARTKSDALASTRLNTLMQLRALIICNDEILLQNFFLFAFSLLLSIRSESSVVAFPLAWSNYYRLCMYKSEGSTFLKKE